jgi:hypothetical protein
MTQWDYDRVGSLLQQASDQAASIAADVEGSSPAKFDLVAILHRVDQLDRDVSAAKALLKRERSKRA